MYLIMIGAYCLTLAAGVVLYKYISDKRREARKRNQHRAA